MDSRLDCRLDQYHLRFVGGFRERILRIAVIQKSGGIESASPAAQVLEFSEASVAAIAGYFDWRP